MPDCKNCSYLNLEALLKPKSSFLPEIKTIDDALAIVSTHIKEPKGVIGLAQMFGTVKAYDIDNNCIKELEVPEKALTPGKGCEGMDQVIDKLKSISGERSLYLITDITVKCCEKHTKVYEF
ncbi:MAG: hypothetical protein ABIB71_00125 [Candidatus Woesearchaeota archaeon]